MGRFCIYSSFGSLPMAEIIRILYPGVSLALSDLSGSTKPSWPSGWPARAKVFSESAKTVQGVKNVCFFQRFTFSDHSLAVTALHCGYGPAPLARLFTASLDQVVLMVLVMLIDICVFMYASGVSRLQPDKRGTASGRLLHQPTHLSGS